MFVRTKKSGGYEYLQIADNRREGKKVSQRVVATLGRLDELRKTGQIERLVHSLSRYVNADTAPAKAEKRTSAVQPEVAASPSQIAAASTQWVFHKEAKTVMNSFQAVAREKSNEATPMDRVEFGVVLVATSAGFLFGRLREAYKQRFRDVPRKLLEDLLAILSIHKEFYDDTRMSVAIGAARREEIGDADDLKDERKAANAMRANEAIERTIGKLMFYAKAIKQELGNRDRILADFTHA